MKIMKEMQKLDAFAEAGDEININIQHDISGGYKLYVDVNGETVLRIGKIMKLIEVYRS